MLLLLACFWVGGLDAQGDEDSVGVYRSWMPRHGLQIGTGFGGMVVNSKPAPLQPKETLRAVELAPRLGFMVSEGLMLGVTGTWGEVWGSLVEDFRYWGVGASIRHYLLTKSRSKIMNREEVRLMGRWQLFKRADDKERRLFALHLFPFVEVGGSLSNARQLPMGQVQVMERPSEPAWHVALGIQVRLWKGLFFEGTYLKAFYPDNARVPNSPLGMRAGFDYLLPLSASSK